MRALSNEKIMLSGVVERAIEINWKRKSLWESLLVKWESVGLYISVF